MALAEPDSTFGVLVEDKGTSERPEFGAVNDGFPFVGFEGKDSVTEVSEVGGRGVAKRDREGGFGRPCGYGTSNVGFVATEDFLAEVWGGVGGGVGHKGMGWVRFELT